MPVFEQRLCLPINGHEKVVKKIQHQQSMHVKAENLLLISFHSTFFLFTSYLVCSPADADDLKSIGRRRNWR